MAKIDLYKMTNLKILKVFLSNPLKDQTLAENCFLANLWIEACLEAGLG